MPFRDVAAWWNGREFYDAEVVARSIARVVPTGRPVYLFRESEVHTKELDTFLAEYGLKTSRVSGTRIYRIVTVSADR